MNKIIDNNCCICFHKLTLENSVVHKIFDCTHSNLSCKFCTLQIETCPICRSLKSNEFINTSIDELYKQFIYIIQSEQCQRFDGNNLFLFIINNKLTTDERFYEYLLSKKNEETKNINHINTIFCKYYIDIFKQKKRYFKNFSNPNWDLIASILTDLYH
jgi:hypothetical protein